MVAGCRAGSSPSDARGIQMGPSKLKKWKESGVNPAKCSIISIAHGEIGAILERN